MVIILYSAINLAKVEWYGEVEFWAALGKGIKFGFRYWNNPGSFKPLYYNGNLGYFLGFLQCLIQASFAIAGPEYVSMSAGNPRVVMAKAFNAIFYRLTTFFVPGALCVGILVAYNDPEMMAAFTNDDPGAAASPYVVAINRLSIGVLPHIVIALVLASAFSAGNSYMSCASRSLFGMALEGKAPKHFTKTTKIGVPYNCVIAVLAICLLVFLQVSAGSAKVLGWVVSLTTASLAIMCFTFLMWYKALRAQDISRDSQPLKSVGQPYVACYGQGWTAVMSIVGGYTIFLPGFWEPSTFVFSYFMVGLTPLLFVAWKFIHNTKWKPFAPETVDLKGEVNEIEEYTRNFLQRPYKSIGDKVFNRIFGG